LGCILAAFGKQSSGSSGSSGLSVSSSSLSSGSGSASSGSASASGAPASGSASSGVRRLTTTTATTTTTAAVSTDGGISSLGKSQGQLNQATTKFVQTSINFTSQRYKFFDTTIALQETVSTLDANGNYNNFKFNTKDIDKIVAPTQAYYKSRGEYNVELIAVVTNGQAAAEAQMETVSFF
jgi:hypothetical protein